MSEKTERELKNWEEEGDYTCAIYEHMEETNLTYWPDIVYEGQRIWKLMFDEELEDDSPVDTILSGVACQAARGVEIAVARMFGLKNHNAVGLALASYIECDSLDKEVPKPITYEEFIKEYENYNKEYPIKENKK